MKKSNYYGILALVLGAVCFALRRWQMAADFDELGLPVPGTATFALNGTAALAVALFAALALSRKGERQWSGVLGERKLLPLYGSAALCAGAVPLLARLSRGPGESVGVFTAAEKVIPILMLLGAAIAAVGLIFAAAGGALRGQYLVLPTLLGCFWTVETYHDHGTDPVIGHFVWLVLAVVSSTLGWYELTALSMDRGHARGALFLGLCSVLFSLTALAGGLNLPETLLIGAQAVSFFTVTMTMSFEKR